MDRRPCVIRRTVSRSIVGESPTTWTARAGARGRGRILARAHGSGTLGVDEAYSIVRCQAASLGYVEV